jgi:putative tRNA adenosine deaminase-associated protein
VPWQRCARCRTVAIVSIDGFAIAVARDGGSWRLTELDDALMDDLDGLLTALRRLSVDGGAIFAMVEVDEEFFAVVRPVPGGAALLLSDATASLDFDLAADILDLLHVEVPDEDDIDDDEPWPEGDMALLADFGLSEQEMAIIVDDDDLYPDEQLQLIANRCGFGEEFAALAGTDRD